MTKWKVNGADADTGAAVELELTAADEASALLAALQRGVYVTRVRRAAAPAGTAAATTPVAPRVTPLPAKLSPPAAAGPKVETPRKARPAPAQASPPRPAEPRREAPPPKHAPVPAPAVAPAAPRNTAAVPTAPPNPSPRAMPRAQQRAAKTAAQPASRPVDGAALDKPAADAARDVQPPPPKPAPEGGRRHASEDPPRPAPAPRRVQVRRAPAEPLPRALAELLSVPQPPPKPRRLPPPPPTRVAPGRANPRRGGAARSTRPDAASLSPLPLPARPAAAARRRQPGLTAVLLCLGAIAGAATVHFLPVPPRPSPAGAAVDPFAAAAIVGDASPEDAPSLVAADGSEDTGGYRDALRDVPLTPQARHGAVEVVLLSAAIHRFGPPAGDEVRRPSDARPRLVLALRVRNASISSRLPYRPWSAGATSASGGCPQLRDDTGRPCRALDVGPAAATPNAALQPGDAATDVLAFEPPSGPFTHLDLELPAENAGGRGSFPLTLRIPAGAVCR